MSEKIFFGEDGRKKMAVDAELISSESFNLKFKNYLRDFYVYQFKERGRDFKAKGIKERAEKEDAGENELLSKDLFNKDIVDRTFYSDAKRLQYALEQSAGVSWNKGDYADIKKNRIDVKRKNKRVECITVDSREIAGNPFFSVYQLCSEGTRVSSTYFSFVYILLVYFQLGKRVKRTASVPLTHGQEEELNEYLQVLAEIIRGEVNSRAPKHGEPLRMRKSGSMRQRRSSELPEITMRWRKSTIIWRRTGSESYFRMEGFRWRTMNRGMWKRVSCTAL